MVAKGESSKLPGTGTKLPEAFSSTSLTDLPSVPTYTQSLLDVDCEVGYSVTAADASHLLAPSPTVIPTTDGVDPASSQTSATLCSYSNSREHTSTPRGVPFPSTIETGQSIR